MQKTYKYMRGIPGHLVKYSGDLWVFQPLKEFEEKYYLKLVRKAKK